MMHILYAVLNSISAIFITFCLIFLNIFYYYPFQAEASTIKLNSSVEIIFLLIKLCYSIKNAFIKNEYISLVIMLLLSFFIRFKELQNPTYNCYILETIIIIRNNINIFSFYWLPNYYF